MTYWFKLTALTIAVLVLAVQAVVFTDIRSTVAQSPNRVPLLAEIVNTEDDPVPVSIEGTSNVSGDINAIQSGDWDVIAEQSGDWGVAAEQEGEWTVGIDQSANTVVVDGLSDANKEIFHAMVLPAWGSDDLGTDSSFTVPAGKRLVIEHVSVEVNLTSSSPNVTRISIRTPPVASIEGPFFQPNTATHIPVERSAAISGGRFDGSEMVRIYVDGGGEVVVQASRDSSSGTGQAWVTMTGYMVELP